MSRDTATLVPRQTLQLAATPRDQNGNPLAGRTITWSTSSGSATVSSDGLVTAVAAGTATVTATSEGKAGSAAITVKDGAVVSGASGGLAATADSVARITVPAAALAADQAITIAPIGNPPAHPRLIAGTGYEFGPAATFAQPATIRIGYAGTTVPVTTDQTRLRLHRLNGGAWVEVLGSTVDVAAKTVSGPATETGSYAIIELAPIPVATVALARDTATLVPTQTLQLDAVTKAQDGTVLAGRPVSWSTDAAGVATVSTSGLVTAVAAGSAAVTATSEGKTATATITVRDGAVIGAAGGTATSSSGKAKVTFPAGAVAATQAVTIAPVTNPTPSPLLVPGTAYEFGPSGGFAQPVTMTISYAGTTVPVAVDPATLKIHRLTNGLWVPLQGSTVDQVAQTVTAPTSSFSTYAVLGGAPAQEVVITFEYGVGGVCSAPGTCGLGTLRSWTVPDDVYSATFELWGASGGGVDGQGKGRGLGGKTTATIAVYPGEVMQIRLGQAGAGPVTVINGGGGGGFGGSGPETINSGTYCVTASSCKHPSGFGGGGGTDVRRGAPVGFDMQGWPERILVAGGGGGDGGYNVVGGPTAVPATPTGTIVPGGAGGLGGGLVGGSGGAGISSARQSAASGGTGGSQLAGGIGGAGSVNPSVTVQPAPGENGTSQWGGGRGGIENGSGGGGGGGGWYGGGGGGPTTFDRGGATAGGGGGGSSYGPLGSVFIQGVHSGHGRAVLTYTPSPGLLATRVTVTSDRNPATTSQAVTFTATVSLKPPATGPVTGSVQFEVDGVVVGQPVVLTNGQAVSNPVTGLTAGAHSVRAIFLGTTTLAPSAGNLAQNVQ